MQERPTIVRTSANTRRRARAAESFQTAAECIGPIEAGMSLFAVTRGQFSMIDAMLHVIRALRPCVISVWTWTIAEYEAEAMRGLMAEGGVTAGTLVIDWSARGRGKSPGIDEWKNVFGSTSVKYCRNHAKIATVEGQCLRVLIRGSMNLNFNPRFEQMDLTEGGPEFDLVREIEAELPVLADDCTQREAYAASKVMAAFGSETLSLFEGVKVWVK